MAAPRGGRACGGSLQDSHSPAGDAAAAGVADAHEGRDAWATAFAHV